MSPRLQTWFQCVVAVAAASAVQSCGGSTTEPTPERDDWYAFVVQCSNCPGLTNPEIDRSRVPYRARLRVGQRTSLRATSRDSCEPAAPQLDVVRWDAANPQVVRIEASSAESAIVTALAPGTATVVVERRYPGGTLSRKNLKEASSAAGCAVMPDLVFEIVP
jgi:hypothetical protein